MARGSIVLALSGGWVALMLVLAVFADLIAPFEYDAQNLLARLKPPAFQGGPEAHLLGTDHLGRDLLSRTIHAIRVSMIVAVLGTLIGAVLGSLAGLVSAHFGGWVDDLIMGLVDVQASLPFLIFALLVIAFFGNDLVLFVLLLGFNGWEKYARLVRGLVLDARTTGYANAARGLGIPPTRIYLGHVLPNILGPLIVQITLNLPETILLEAGLSFIGLGIQPPETSLGLLLNDSRNYIALYWWLPFAPGVAIFGTALSVSLLGDALRDRADRTTPGRAG
jgi:peptide/nickel transport system permease protein